MTNSHQQQEENDAWFARADSFDGFDRGDLGRDDDADFYANCEADAD